MLVGLLVLVAVEVVVHVADWLGVPVGEGGKAVLVVEGVGDGGSHWPKRMVNVRSNAGAGPGVGRGVEIPGVGGSGGTSAYAPTAQTSCSEVNANASKLLLDVPGPG